MWSSKARPHNPMGMLIWDYCEKNEVLICNYLMNQQHNEEANQEKITASLDSTFKNGYYIKLSTQMNQFMVDFDSICILKYEMGFKC
jgi:hypothetical protein